jgi:hypothetical protein
LNGEGHQVVHLSRHGPFEEGKDVLAIAPDGTPCAYQLKSGNITLRVWEEIVPQVVRLVEVDIVHPSIDRDAPRRAYLVTTGELDEEVRVEIDKRNHDWQRRGHPKLETTVRQLKSLNALHTSFWPTQLASEKSLLEFFLSDGTNNIDKTELAEFILQLLPLTREKLNKSESARLLASTAILTAYALSPYSEKLNHVALIEGWTVYAACLVALVEKSWLEREHWNDILNVALYAIELGFSGLCDELRSRTHLVEGNALVDYPFYRGRVTWLLGLVACFALWKHLRDPTWSAEEWFGSFVQSHQKHLVLLGEAAVPQFLAIIWFLRKITSTREPDGILASLIDTICESNKDEDSNGLADPYQNLADVFAEQHGISSNPKREKYGGRSYTLESLVHLCVRRNWRQRMKELWPKITFVEFAEFQPDSAWQFCLWRSEEYGRLRVAMPQRTQSWAELRKKASEVDLSRVPTIFQQHPELLLVFVITYPHRLTKDAAKFLDDALRRRS